MNSHTPFVHNHLDSKVLHTLPDWLNRYDLFFFDFDGLLVNTEEVHYMAYKQMCANRDVLMTWDFPRYCRAAHYDAHALRDQFHTEFPALFKNGEAWEKLYAEKKAALIELISQGAVQLMPGVENFLKMLAKSDKRRCVVTHSPLDFVGLLKQQLPILQTIPYWITREDYSKPKPDPECYLTALKRYKKTDDKVVGFEDTPRGLTALMKTDVQSVLVTKINYPEIPSFLEQGVIYYPSFSQILK